MSLSPTLAAITIILLPSINIMLQYRRLLALYPIHLLSGANLLLRLPSLRLAESGNDNSSKNNIFLLKIKMYCSQNSEA